MIKLSKSQKKQARARIRADILAFERQRGLNIDYSQGGAAARARLRRSKHCGSMKFQSGTYFSPLLSESVEPDQATIRSMITTLVDLHEREAAGEKLDMKNIVEKLAASQGFKVTEKSE